MCSLKNLGVEYIDLFQFHRYDYEAPLIESISAINDLIRQGKVLYWGLSRFDASEISNLFIDLNKNTCMEYPISNQWFYNLLSANINDELTEIMQRNNISLISYSPLGRGTLTSNYVGHSDVEALFNITREHFNSIMGKLTKFANKRGISLQTIALAWVC